MQLLFYKYRTKFSFIEDRAIKRIIAISFMTSIYLSYAYCQNTVSKAFLLGKYNYIKDTSFVKVPSIYASNLVFMKKEAYQAFLKMREAALKDGIKLFIISGTRSFDDQKYKWESKWNAPEFSGISNIPQKVTRLLRWWSMPGSSRHHWGTDVDLNNMQLAYYKTPEGKKLFDWLNRNGPKYGFYQPFNGGRTNGYQEEKWHWSYVPLSRLYLKEYINMVTYPDISGFPGSASAKELDIIKNWVLAVNPLCK